MLYKLLLNFYNLFLFNYLFSLKLQFINIQPNANDQNIGIYRI